jgi:glycosyltransferase involved in cell wall biosynthesis
MAISVIHRATGRIVAEAARSPRLAIFTDATRLEEVPDAVRRAAEMISTEDLGALQGQSLAAEMDGAIVWLSGEKLLRGSSDDLRREFFTPSPACTLVPVHLPYLAEAELISVQPRLMAKGARRERLSRSVRIWGACTLTAQATSALAQAGEPWSALHLALMREAAGEDGLEELVELWQGGSQLRAMAALVLRNLILILLRRRNFAKAEKLLKAGQDVYPDYAELHYLEALFWLAQEKPSQATKSLNQMRSCTGRDYVGSGGEASYRASWLMGTILESLGDQQKAMGLFLPGLHQRPAFYLSVAGILRQRLSRERVRQLQLVLCELVRREPQYLEPVFDFFVRHRELDAPRRLLRTLPLGADVHKTLQSRLDEVAAKIRPRREGSGAKPGVILKGPFLMHSGHARINRELGRALVESRAIDAGLEQFEYAKAAPAILKDGELIRQGLRNHAEYLDLTIRHQWPPDFARPECGKLACILPWEHRAVPKKWVEEIQRNMDELWVPSQFVAAAFAEGGVEAEHVKVIPNGVDTDVYNTDGESWRPTGCRDFAFLFVGGTIRRKGIDLLLQAYLEAFTPDDDVTLVVKDLGATSFYRHNNLLNRVHSIAGNHNAAHVLALTNEFNDAELAMLYRGCDAFVLPYRAEGFGMPLMEAMACGKPVVTTAAGPALEFCPAENSYLVRAEEVAVPDEPPPVGEMSREWTWFEPDLIELAETLRRVYENREGAAQRGQVAAEAVAKNYCWPRITQLYLDRILALTTIGKDHLAAQHQFAGIAP